MPIVLSWGWRRRLIAFAAGALSALAMAPVQCLADPVSDLPDAGLADRRRRGGPLGRTGGRGSDRLVVRLRLLSRRPLLDRLRLLGRCAGLRLAVADRGHRPAGGARRLYRARRGAGANAVDARGAAYLGSRRGAHRFGMAARPPVHRFSLECIRLRADRAAGLGASRFAVRHLGPDLHRHRGVRQSRHAQ